MLKQSSALQWDMRNSSISDICPGVEYLINQNNTNNTALQVSVTDCKYDLPGFTAHQGIVYGTCEGSNTYCKMHVEVPQSMYIRARIERLAYWCGSRQWKTTIFKKEEWWEEGGVACDYHTLEELFIDAPENHMSITNRNNPLVKINLMVIKCHDCIMKRLTEYSRYLTVSLTYGDARYQRLLLQEKFKVPFGYIMMVNVQKSLWPVTWHECDWKINIFYIKQNTVMRKSACFEHSTPVNFFLTPYLEIAFYYCKFIHGGLRIAFFFLSDFERPQKLSSGLFNCSVNHYFKFQQHLECNLKPECEDGRDETEHCPFSGPGCRGMVISRNKCFKLILSRHGTAFAIFALECEVLGGRLASIKSREEKQHILPMFKNYRAFMVTLGYTSGWKSLPYGYSKFRKWADNTLIYSMDHFFVSDPYFPSRIVKSRRLISFEFLYESQSNRMRSPAALCEFELKSLSVFPSQIILARLHITQSMFTSTLQVLFVCVDSHVTHLFLSCDHSSHCGTSTYSQLSMLFNASDQLNTEMGPVSRIISTYAPFRCDDDSTAVHYTLVCDFRQDCPDGSDESFCEQPLCNGVSCSNGQCVLHSQRCNEYSDCLDHSDEVDCPIVYTYTPLERHMHRKQHLCISLDGTGYFTRREMETDESCSDTHYRCPTEQMFCLPVYTRCNGFSDCVYGEDEQDCETVMCPGYYRCRGSRVCVHGDHLCDGWGQCPQRDDELMCDVTCPEGCLCQGHSFVCNNPFPAYLFRQLRNVDATGSEMTLTDFSKNAYLIRLSMSHCSLVNISVVILSNLQFIDISSNLLKTLDIAAFLGLLNLRILKLGNNPLRQVTCKTQKRIHYALKEIDMSKSHLHILNEELSIYFPLVKYLNVSFSHVQTVGSTGFKNIPQLTELDVRGNPVINFPFDLFSGSSRLKRIYSSNYRVCCTNILPTQKSKITCLSPERILASCKRLIPNELYRIFFWSFSASSLLGNLVGLVVLFEVKDMFGSNFVIASVHFILANILMGCHVSIVMVADEVFHGKYLLIEKTWTNSVTCRANAFLSLVSSEVSVFIIWFITLDHIIILCFPGDSWRFNTKSTFAACAVMWFVGMLLTMIPFLPGLSHWGLYGLSGLCRLALVDQYNSDQGFSWFSVTVVCNFILCFIVVVGEIVIYRQTPKYRIALDSTKRSVYSSVHLMRKVIATDAVCWFLFGLVTMMASFGVTNLDRIHNGMVAFLLPFSSALNPVYFMWTALTQRRYQAKEERLLEVLKSRLALARKKASTNK